MPPNVATLLGVPQISTTVPDIAEAISFYEGDLGLQLLFKTPSMAMFACGGTRIMVATPDQNPTQQPTFLYFSVQNIVAAQAALARKGVKFKGQPRTVGRFENRDVWLSEFFDRAGNLHHLISEVPASAATPTARAAPA